MATSTRSIGALATPAASRAALGRLVEREAVFSWLMLGPAVLFLVGFVAYPFVYGIYLSLESRQVGRDGTFVWLANFVANARDPVFWQVVRNTVVYTGAATVVKLVGGLGLALVINQRFGLKNAFSK